MPGNKNASEKTQKLQPIAKKPVEKVAKRHALCAF